MAEDPCVSAFEQARNRSVAPGFSPRIEAGLGRGVTCDSCFHASLPVSPKEVFVMAQKTEGDFFLVILAEERRDGGSLTACGSQWGSSGWNRWIKAASTISAETADRWD
ncbi:hypothetical protein FRC12_008623 [Ceratobasidium sp. 428]|nr:hypothetical protein FRC12_008623 [Ceratobasidium sp. 428]